MSGWQDSARTCPQIQNWRVGRGGGTPRQTKEWKGLSLSLGINVGRVGKRGELQRNPCIDYLIVVGGGGVISVIMIFKLKFLLRGE